MIAGWSFWQVSRLPRDGRKEKPAAFNRERLKADEERAKRFGRGRSVGLRCRQVTLNTVRQIAVLTKSMCYNSMPKHIARVSLFRYTENMSPIYHPATRNVSCAGLEQTKEGGDRALC